MLSKQKRRLFTRTLFVLGISIGVFVFIFKKRVTDVYHDTIEPTEFENVVLEKDTALNSTFPVKDLPADTSINQANESFSFPNPALRSNNKWNAKTVQENTTDATTKKRLIKGKEIKAKDIPDLHKYNSRVRLTLFFKKFNQGDYISGKEFSNLYRRDPSISKLSKVTICNFIEKNIRQLSKDENTFVIQTVDTNGIHTKLKIPFVEDLRINIDNGAKIVIGETFTSKAPAFSKSILLPIQLEFIDIKHNGEQFPTTGYISGDFYFIDYSKTKMAYKLR
jgi:hypothetical protein